MHALLHSRFDDLTCFPFLTGVGFPIEQLPADVRIWSTVLSESEILRRWALPLAGDAPHLVGWWPFDEGAGACVADHTPAHRHGELAGPTWHMSVVVPESDLSAHMRTVLRDGIGADVVSSLVFCWKVGRLEGGKLDEF